jgi:hypothetical protein
MNIWYFRVFFPRKYVNKIRVSLQYHMNDRYFAGIHAKGKAVPLQAWGGPEGSRKLRFPDFLTTAQDGGKVVSLTHLPHVLYKEVKVKQSHYRPGVAQSFPGS